MIIGIDAGCLGINDPRLQVGVWRVAVNLIRELAKIDQKNEYRLFSFAPINPAWLPKQQNFKNIVLQPSFGWFSWRLPLELIIHPIDVFLGLNQAIPPVRAKKIGLLHDLGFLAYPRMYPGSVGKLKRNTNYLCRASDYIVTVSYSIKKEIKDFYQINSQKIKVIYSGVEACFRQKPNVRQKPYFLFVGSFKPQKNLPFLLDAFAKMNDKSLKLFLVGSNYWIPSDLLTRFSKLNKQIRLLNFVSDSRLAQLYRNATALIVPSLVEGFCLPVVEAMASGCPVITTSAGALPEIVGKAGILVAPGDLVGLVRAMQQMRQMTVRKKYQKLGLVRSRQFNWSLFAQKIYDLYEK